MRRKGFALLLLGLCLLLSGCRFAVVESDSIRVSAPTATPEAPGSDRAESVETKN